MAPRLNRIRELRGLRGLTQRQVAERMEVHPRTVYRWEKSITRMTDDEMDLLAEVLDTSVPWMMRLGEPNDGNGERQAA